MEIRIMLDALLLIVGWITDKIVVEYGVGRGRVFRGF